MRISGGKARGVNLKVDQKAVHRPAMDKLRQSIFSSIGGAVAEARVLDLFAGTGSYGLEALSRGALKATFVELNKRATVMIKDNLAAVSKSMQQPLDASVIAADVGKWDAGADRFDLIFVDPPYDMIVRMTPLLFNLFDKSLTPDGIVVFETPGQIEPTATGWRLRKRLGRGIDQPTACIFERASA